MLRYPVALLLCCLVAACSDTVPAPHTAVPSGVAPAVAPAAAPVSLESSVDSWAAASPAATADGSATAFVRIVAPDGSASIGAYSAASGRLVAHLPVGVPAADWSVLFAADNDAGLTTVRAFNARTATVLRATQLAGSWSLPTVIPDALPEGLAEHASLLVLQDAAPPTGMSRFALVDTTFATAPRIVELAGMFEYDAIGPDGRYLFLVERLSTGVGGHYQVRAYDTTLHRLVDGPIVDKREIGGLMEGAPVARATATDGQWAYTLYLRADGSAFVHELDTLHAVALCADLPDGLRAVTDRERRAWRIALGGASLPFVANGHLRVVGQVGMGEVPVVQQLAAAADPFADLAVGMPPARLYLAGPTTISILDGSTLRLVGRGGGGAPGGALISADGGTLFAAATATRSAGTAAVIEQYAIGPSPLRPVATVPLAGLSGWERARLVGLASAP